MNSLKQTSLNQLLLKAPRAIQLPCSLPREHFFKTCPRGFILRMLLQAQASLASLCLTFEGYLSIERKS
ncbi:MAG: hypothetical protein ACTS68_01785 [Candidatus Hodgkinia cicadicola]